MTLPEYQQHVAALGFGKRLPTALYVYRSERLALGDELDRLLAQVVAAFEVGPEFNVIKLRTDELKLSFLSYPRFFDDPHPALRLALTIDLVRGKTRLTDYSGNPNPPILHRKEAFLPAGHPKRRVFSALTEAEEAAGLYADTSTIGFKLNWERLLAAKGLRHAGHRLPPASSPSTPKDGPHQDPAPSATGPDSEPPAAIDRHKTAMARYELSKPVKTLVDAFRHTRRLLVVSALICETVDVAQAAPFRDGVVTKRNTFQKYFDQQELQQYVEDALDTTAVPVSLGVFYVFRDPVEQQDFIEARTRRSIDWSQISARLGIGGPKALWEKLYAEHKEFLDSFGKLALALGRFPEPAEFDRADAIPERLGSARRALRAYVQGGGRTART
jgi:hypothetical protein